MKKKQILETLKIYSVEIENLTQTLKELNDNPTVVTTLVKSLQNVDKQLNFLIMLLEKETS